MKLISSGNYEYDDGEPVLRSCPECNPSHDYLMKTNKLHCCFSCGRYWLLGKYLDEFKTDEELDKFIQDHLAELTSDWNCAPICFEIQLLRENK